MTRIDSVGTRGPSTAFEESLVPLPRARWTRGRVLRAILGTVIALAVIVPFAWWQVEAQTYRLTPGGTTLLGNGAVTLEAGDTTELCYPFVPGGTVQFGLSVENDGSQVVTLTSVGRAFANAPQTVTADSETAGGDAGFPEAIQHLPLTIRPGQIRNLYFTIRIPNLSMSDGQMLAHTADLHFRVLGMSRTQHFTFGTPDPLWIGLSGADENGRFCNFNRPTPN